MDGARDSIRFIRHGRIVELKDVAPTTTLLDYLRRVNPQGYLDIINRLGIRK